ncbi:hypothetical protein CEXT_107591 [Caerostris extrusa]|uniref:Uncharacterized protein n=1 Tax=Caerostris extrusa TaxID=172846 RepID=A0AAV4TQD4_CAEEX|nr:hypothetical protein CEXT_107591 [Caerostris extrusa]
MKPVSLAIPHLIPRSSRQLEMTVQKSRIPPQPNSAPPPPLPSFSNTTQKTLNANAMHCPLPLPPIPTEGVYPKPFPPNDKHFEIRNVEKSDRLIGRGIKFKNCDGGRGFGQPSGIVCIVVRNWVSRCQRVTADLGTR